MTTDLHITSRDKDLYLRYTTAHLDNTKSSTVFSQALMVSRIYSNKTDFKRHLDDMKSWFQARGYPKHLFQKEMNKVWFNKQKSNTKRSKSKQVIFVVTYYPLLKSLQSLINKHLNILYLGENAKKVFILGPMVTFRSCRKLSSYVVRAMLYPLEWVTGSCKCRWKRCEVCLNVNETSTFTSLATHETSKVNHKFDYNNKCLIYLSTSKQCSKQYVGKTADDLQFRWNNYKDNRKYQLSETSMQEHLFRHFLSPGHNGPLNDVSITFIDKTNPSDPLKREGYWRRTLKTMTPYGLNIEDSLWSIIMVINDSVIIYIYLALISCYCFGLV